jgi:hypothetical protein
MPLMKLQSKPTTSLSCYDRMERNQTKIITNAERKSEGVPPAKRARIQ